VQHLFVPFIPFGTKWISGAMKWFRRIRKKPENRHGNRLIAVRVNGMALAFTKEN